MGNYISAWESLVDRWISIWDRTGVLSSENPALTWNYQMNKHDGAGLSWDVNRLSALNELEFCSMIGHDADVRVFLYPIIEERYAVIRDTFLRAEFEWEAYDAADFTLWNDQDIFDVWEIWRMCHDQASTYAASRAEICNNFGMAGNDEPMEELLSIFIPTGQRELAKTTDFNYEAIGFREFAMRLYAVMYADDRRKKKKGLRNFTKDFLEELILDIRLRRQATPYRCKALFHMF